MTETEKKIIYQWKSIEKNSLFAECDWERKIARVWITMLLYARLKLPIVEANKIANQLRPEREAFYSLID